MINILGFQGAADAAPSPSGELETDEQEHQGAQNLEAVGNAELNQFIDQGRDVFSLLRDLFLDGRNGVGRR